MPTSSPCSAQSWFVTITSSWGRGSSRPASVATLLAATYEWFLEVLCLTLLGLVDLTIVNYFVSYNAYKKDTGSRPVKRADFMTELQNQLLALTAQDFAEVEPLTRTGTPVITRKRQRTPTAHTATLTDEWREEGKTRKRRQRTCKVCSLKHRKVGESASGTSHFCEACSEGSAELWLHPMARRASESSRTCFDAWHEEFDCGRDLPADVNTSTKMRRVGVAAQKRRWRQVASSASDGVEL